MLHSLRCRTPIERCEHDAARQTDKHGVTLPVPAGVARHRAGLSVGVPPDTVAPQAPHLNCSVRGLSRACRTQRRLHGDIEISIVGLQHADRYISVVNTDTAQWSRPDLCLVAGLGVVAVEERALVGSCDRRTAVGRRDYAVIITLLWLGRRAARPRTTTGANVHTVGKGTKTTNASTRSGQ